MNEEALEKAARYLCEVECGSQRLYKYYLHSLRYALRIREALRVYDEAAKDE